MKRQATDLEKAFVNHMSNTGVTYRIYKDLSKLNSKKSNNLIRK